MCMIIIKVRKRIHSVEGNGVQPKAVTMVLIHHSCSSVLTHPAASVPIPVPHSHLEGIELTEKYRGDKVPSRILKKKKKKSFSSLFFHS